MISFMKPTLQSITLCAATVDLYKFQVCVSNLNLGLIDIPPDLRQEPVQQGVTSAER
jgi:hypothetical protein